MGSTTLLTADDLFGVPEPDLPHELRRGVLRVVTPASSAHGAVNARLLAALAQHVYTHDLGALFTAGAGFLLERDPDTVLCPDIALVAKARLPAAGLEPRFLELAPRAACFCRRLLLASAQSGGDDAPCSSLDSRGRLAGPVHPRFGRRRMSP